jgi:hypothetical protein
LRSNRSARWALADVPNAAFQAGLSGNLPRPSAVFWQSDHLLKSCSWPGLLFLVLGCSSSCNHWPSPRQG